MEIGKVLFWLVFQVETSKDQFQTSFKPFKQTNVDDLQLFSFDVLSELKIRDFFLNFNTFKMLMFELVWSHG
jgi:hypothetical protein